MENNFESLLHTKPGQKLVLEIGANKKPQARFIEAWNSEEKAKVLTLDVDEKMEPDILCDAADMPPELYGKLDGLIASHVLEHFSYWKTNAVLEGWIKCLKDGGELHILVPSLEWAAREVLAENPSPAVYAQLFAGQVNQWDVHLTGFTMRKLRQLMDTLGLSCTTAKTGVYHVRVGKLGEFEAHQHYVVGVKGMPELKKQ
jgi:predicted SAM-dependent methyltransferase